MADHAGHARRLWNPAFTVAASQLLDGAVRFWHDQLFCKPPQARRRRGLAPGLFLLDPHQARRASDLLDRPGRCPCENGCLHYIPGSHRWPLLPITGLAGDMNAIQTVLNEEQKAQFRPCPSSSPRATPRSTIP